MYCIVLRCIFKSGEMLYCKDRARTSCCFHKHECEGSWAAISSQMGQKAEAYLTDKVITALMGWIIKNICFPYLLKT